MKSYWEYVFITETLSGITDVSSRKAQEEVVGRLNQSIREMVKDAEEAPYKYEFEIVSHSIVHIKDSLLLTVLFRRQAV